jgi:hypothetical protein
MKVEEIKINLEELKKFKQKNFKERLKFLEFWTDYIKKHSDNKWSEEQNKIINSQLDKIKGNI